MRIVSSLLFILACTHLHGQQQGQSFEVLVSSDTVLVGSTFEIRFEARNINGTFEPPSFAGFEKVGGPSQSTNMSFVNGMSSQSAAYSYLLSPTEAGVTTLEPAYYVTNDTTWESPPIDIACLPNPDGIRRDTRITADDKMGLPSWFGRNRMQRPAPKKKKKLKETKI
ncbi:MAG: hypothetical protein HKN87_23660 [Saprospiraceae bacterium]|nr:hypothetical protein [Saprospiraceae bacterium]